MEMLVGSFSTGFLNCSTVDILDQIIVARGCPTLWRMFGSILVPVVSRRLDSHFLHCQIPPGRGKPTLG